MSVKRHATYNLTASMVSIAVQLFAVPLFLVIIGIERYGVLTIAWLLTAYFGAFDLGVSKAVVQRISNRTALERKSQESTFWSGLAIVFIFSLVGAALLFPVGSLIFRNILEHNDVIYQETTASIPYIAMCIPVGIVNTYLGSALQSNNRFLEFNVVSAASAVLGQILPLAMAYFVGPSVTNLIICILLSRIAATPFLWQTCRRYAVCKRPVTIERSEILALVRPGGWFTVSAFVGPLMIVFDRFVIGFVNGPATVTIYTVPFQLAQNLLLIPGAVQSAMFPKQAAMLTSADQRSLTNTGIYAVAAVMTPLVALSIFIVEPFLQLWMGSAFHENSANVARVALIGVWATSVAYVPCSQIQARGEARTAAIVHVLEFLPYALTLYIAMHYFGLPGAAFAFSIRCIVDLAIFNKLANGQHSEWRTPLLMLTVLGACAVVAWITNPFSLPWLGAFAIALSLTTVLSAYYAPTEVKGAVHVVFTKIRRLSLH